MGSKLKARGVAVLLAAAGVLSGSTEALASKDVWGPWLQCYPASTHEWCAEGHADELLAEVRLTHWNVPVESNQWKVRVRTRCCANASCTRVEADWWTSPWSTAGLDDRAYRSCGSYDRSGGIEVILSRE